MRQNKRAAGFTLVELMVTTIILSVLTIQIFSMFSTQQKSFVTHEDTVEAQEDSRLATSFILSDLRMAGFMVPRLAGIASADGGTGGSDRFCVSDSSVINDTTLVEAAEHFDRASLTGDIDGNDGSVIVSAGELDIDEDGDSDFTVGRGIIISAGTNSHCATIQTVNTGSNTITFLPQTPGGFVGPIPGVRVVPARVYQMTSNGITRDGMVLSNLVEDIQVEFGVDANDNGQLDGGEFPIHDLDGFDPALVRTVRLTLITRTPLDDPDHVGSGRPAAANRTAGAADGFRRRSFLATAMPRNLQ